MRTYKLVTIAFVSMTLLAGCSSGAQFGGTPVAGGSTDDSPIVSCLVPGQIRQLDNNVTYLTAPRPVTTTARDCERRGGRIDRS